MTQSCRSVATSNFEEFDKLKTRFVIRISAKHNLTNRDNQQQKTVDIARSILRIESYTVAIDKEGHKEELTVRLISPISLSGNLPRD